jgi:nucleoside-diphosphate-sugar epimerase
LRLVNVTGPATPRASLLGTVADELRSAEAAGRTAVLRLAPLRSQRDFVDVRDIADAVDAAARAPVSGHAINIGRGQAVSVRALVHRLIAASGVPAEVIEQDGPEPAGAPRSGVDWQQVDIAAARSLLDWQPGYPLAESLRALWSHVRAAGSHPVREVLETGRPG